MLFDGIFQNWPLQLHFRQTYDQWIAKLLIVATHVDWMLDFMRNAYKIYSIEHWHASSSWGFVLKCVNISFFELLFFLNCSISFDLLNSLCLFANWNVKRNHDMSHFSISFDLDRTYTLINRNCNNVINKRLDSNKLQTNDDRILFILQKKKKIIRFLFSSSKYIPFKLIEFSFFCIVWWAMWACPRKVRVFAVI